MKRFKSARHAQRFLSVHDQINNLFHLRRDQATAAELRMARRLGRARRDRLAGGPHRQIAVLGLHALGRARSGDGASLGGSAPRGRRATAPSRRKTSPSMSLSRNAGAYCSSPRPRSHSTTSIGVAQKRQTSGT